MFRNQIMPNFMTTIHLVQNISTTICEFDKEPPDMINSLNFFIYFSIYTHNLINISSEKIKILLCHQNT